MVSYSDRKKYKQILFRLRSLSIHRLHVYRLDFPNPILYLSPRFPSLCYLLIHSLLFSLCPLPFHSTGCFCLPCRSGAVWNPAACCSASAPSRPSGRHWSTPSGPGTSPRPWAPVQGHTDNILPYSNYQSAWFSRKFWSLDSYHKVANILHISPQYL